MNGARTSSMLQRIPVILAVTAASYGLQVPPQALRWGTGQFSGLEQMHTEPARTDLTRAPTALPQPGRR
ncbi:hypothetical protein WG922_17350 [Ramlibacter sp. AN1015]|uniref:hypothetical protein n=1 Tax=Ramlibacter sp. AN1015 TaxID=3133428 RepID=UPI0030C5B7F9